MATFETLAAKCAAGVALDLLVAIASVESGMQALSVRDGAALTRVGSAGEGVALAVGAADQSREARIGLMGLTERQLRAAGLTLTDGFDACASLSVAAGIIAATRGSAPAQSADASDRAAIRTWWHAGGQFPNIVAFEAAVGRERSYAAVLAKREITSSPSKAPTSLLAEVSAAVPSAKRATPEPDCWDIFARQRAGLAQCADTANSIEAHPRVRSHQPETASVVIFGSNGTPR